MSPTPGSPLRASLLIGLCCLVVYNANLRAITAGDTYPARYLPFAILQHHTVFLDPIADLTARGRGDLAYWMVPLPDGHIVSLYPIATPLLIAPLYLPAVTYLHLRGGTEARLDYLARLMEKLSASLVAALSASLLYLLLRRRTTAPIALLLTIAYAFGTTTWVISSQALWQHGMAELLVVAALLCVTTDSTTPRAIAAGLLCGLIAANRPPDVILAAALGVYGLFWAGRRRAPLLVAFAALPMVLVLLYNLGIAGNIAGGYGVLGKSRFFSHDLLSGIAGLLFSPTRGLFVFSPFLLFVPLVLWRLPRDRKERGLIVAMGVAVVLQILLYAKTDWRGGISWGPRYMTDFLPFLMWMLVPVVASQRFVARAAFVLGVIVAVGIEVIGAFWYTGATDVPVIATERGPGEMRAAWDWRNTPFIASLKQGVAPAELTARVQGGVDAMPSAIPAGQDAVATGWTLVGHATPWQVAVIIDGRQTTATQAFIDRPDVRDTLHETSPAGWRIPFSTAGLAPGQHHQAFLAWARPTSEVYYLEGRQLTVQRPATTSIDAQPLADAELSENAKKAAQRIREHQQAPGYWLTAYTNESRFHEPRPEMNTFLTALLIDLLDPVAREGDLEDSLQRARRHLTDQIEPTGLVRYHGLPNGPGIGTLGCVITPDTDDTALAWRIAPAPDRARLTAALATIDGYRNSQGLYRTWLARRADYQCLDPGSDPNPTDIAIQMHMLMLLARERPAAGRALCATLRSSLDEDDLWVYYRRTPLVPILRLHDLHLAGCDVDLPASRMHTDVPGQRIWVEVAQLLSNPKPSDAARMRAVLAELAKDDFALLRTNPPLLYHNDLSASVSRYYWSEDAGYALWLRLEHNYVHDGLSHLGR